MNQDVATKSQWKNYCWKTRLPLKLGPRPWTRTLKNLVPEKLGLGKSWTLKNLNPEKPVPKKTWTQKKLDPEKSGHWKIWTLKNLNSEKPGLWKMRETAGCRKKVYKTIWYNLLTLKICQEKTCKPVEHLWWRFSTKVFNC